MRLIQTPLHFRFANSQSAITGFHLYASLKESTMAKNQATSSIVCVWMQNVYMLLDLQKPNIIVQYRFFSTMHWVIAYFEEKNPFTSLHALFLKGQQLNPGYHHIHPSKRSSKSVWLQWTERIVTYGCLLTWRWSGCSWSMFLHEFWLCLWCCRRSNLPIDNPFLSSWRTRWCKFRVHASLHS